MVFKHLKNIIKFNLIIYILRKQKQRSLIKFEKINLLISICGSKDTITNLNNILFTKKHSKLSCVRKKSYINCLSLKKTIVFGYMTFLTSSSFRNSFMVKCINILKFCSYLITCQSIKLVST